jgi:pimeloyl-ACP methyl ester carboxylesterase
MKSTQSIVLADGRRLGYAEYGDPAGRPVFLFHGLPGSRLQRPPDEQVALDLGARIVTIDRPGFGRSDFLPERSLVDWPRDVAALANALAIEQFAVAGISAGGPYALACAARLGDRVIAAAIASSPCPTYLPGVLHGMIRSNQIVIRTAQRTPPRLAAWAARMVNTITMREPKLIAALVFGLVSTPLTAEDRIEMARPAIQEMYLESVLEAYRNGWNGHAWELIVLNRPWGFRLDAIRVPVFLWHGEADQLIPPVMGHYLAERIPGCQAEFIPGSGHLLVFAHWPRMLARLLGARSVA